MPVHKLPNSRLCAKTIVRPIEVFKPLVALAADNTGNVSNKQQMNAMQMQMQMQQKQYGGNQGYNMEQRGLILKPPPKKKKNLPGTKLLIKLDKERKKANMSKLNDDMIDDIVDDLMYDLC